jgi:hypothetical protein
LFPASTGGKLCGNALCADELAARTQFGSAYSSAPSADATYTATAPTGATGRCVQCVVMPAKHTAALADASETVGLCSELCRTAYNQEPIRAARIGSWLENMRYGLKTREFAEEVIGMMDAASQWKSHMDPTGPASGTFVAFLRSERFYALLYQLITRDGQRPFSSVDYRDFASTVRKGVIGSPDSQLLRLEVPNSRKYSTGALAGETTKLFKNVWLRAPSPLREADVGAYAGRIYRDVMILRRDSTMVRAALDAIFNPDELISVARVHADGGSSKPFGAPYEVALADHPTLADHLALIEGPLDWAKRAASATKAAAAKGTKSIVSKTAGGVAGKAASVVDSAQRVPLGEYSIDRFARNIEAALRVYVWFRKEHPEAAANRMIDFIVFFVTSGRLLNLYHDTEAQPQFLSGLDQLRGIALGALAANERKQNIQPKWEPVPVEMPQTCANYDQLAMDMYGMIMIAGSGVEKRTKNLGDDLERVFMRLAPKYRKPETFKLLTAIISGVTERSVYQ